jgi:peptidoglycan L-alanyl-D-glutamate endopeptidase CwlK
MDLITVKRINTLHPKLVNETLEIYKQITEALKGRAFCRFSYTLRTFQEQADIYAQGRTKLYDNAGRRLGIVTRAQAGMSFHNYGLAVDIVLMVDTDGNGSYETAKWDVATDFDGDGVSDWMECVKIFKKHGWVWGGDFKSLVDKPHFEKAFGYTTRRLLAMHQAKQVDCNGYVLI